MKIQGYFPNRLHWIAVVLLILSIGMSAQSALGAQTKVFPQEQLDSLLAPVALYPDSLLTQILMASTYPLEVVADWERDSCLCAEDSENPRKKRRTVLAC